VAPSLGNQSDAGSAISDISSAIFGIQILSFPKYQVLIPAEKINVVSVAL
jgi:hypothetical protein